MRIRRCSCLHILSNYFIPLLSCLLHSMPTIFNRPLSPSIPFSYQRSSTNFPTRLPHFSHLKVLPLSTLSRFNDSLLHFGPLHSSLQYLTRPPYYIYLAFFSIYPCLLCSLLSSLPFLFLYISPPPPWPLLFNVCIYAAL